MLRPLIHAEIAIEMLMDWATELLGPEAAREILLAVVAEAAFQAAETFEPPSDRPAVMHSDDPWAVALRVLMWKARHGDTDMDWEVTEALEGVHREVEA